MRNLKTFYKILLDERMTKKLELVQKDTLFSSSKKNADVQLANIMIWDRKKHSSKLYDWRLQNLQSLLPHGS